MILRLLFAGGCFSAALLAAAEAAGLVPLCLAAHDTNPRDTSRSIERGLQLERSGDLRQAEIILLEAARLDHQYQPAWTLANFYFRKNQPDQFWRWARRAAELSYDGGRPILRLAVALEDNPSAVIARLGHHHELLRTYLDILIGEDRKDAAYQVAFMLAEFHDPADQPRFEALRKRYEETK